MSRWLSQSLLRDHVELTLCELFPDGPFLHHKTPSVVLSRANVIIFQTTHLYRGNMGLTSLEHLGHGFGEASIVQSSWP